MPLGTEVGFGPGNIVSDGDPAPPQKGAQHLGKRNGGKLKGTDSKPVAILSSAQFHYPDMS